MKDKIITEQKETSEKQNELITKFNDKLEKREKENEELTVIIK